MRRHSHGWTLVEVMVSTAILALLLTLVAQSLAMAQRSWLSTRASAEMQRNLDAAGSALSRHIALATLQPRQRFDATTNTLVRESDLHFVCGPSSELLPAIPRTCGDAIFFQYPAKDGALQAALQPCGFFVQYSDDSASRPAFLRSATPRRRFRLMQFHQAANSLNLFQSPSLSTLTNRSDLYAWFAQPLINSSTMNSNVSIVAENVIAIIIQTAPGGQRCYDSRRHQWEGETETAQASCHRLPQSVEVNLLITDETSWSKLNPSTADMLSAALINLAGDSLKSGGFSEAPLAALRERMETQGLRARVFKMMTAP